jgi:hypothetical protein
MEQVAARRPNNPPAVIGTLGRNLIKSTEPRQEGSHELSQAA